LLRSHGPFYYRQGRGFQIDLAFIRKDHVITICECKFSQSLVSSSIIREVDSKIDALKKIAAFKKYTIQKVLITTHGADDAVKRHVFFDVILTLDDLFSMFD